MSAARQALRSNARSRVVLGSVMMQLGLGGAYAYSVYRQPLAHQNGWSDAQVSLPFSVMVFTVGAVSFGGGVWMERFGPRRVGLCAGLVYGVGMVLAGFSGHSLMLLTLGHGVLVGAGIGVGTLVAVATPSEWYTRRRGLVGGAVTAAYAVGGAVAAPLVARLVVAHGPNPTMLISAAAYLVVLLLGAMALTRPAERGGDPCAPVPVPDSVTLRAALHQTSWYVLWLLLFLNVGAGMALMSAAGPTAEEFAHVSAVSASGLVGSIFLAGAAGRFLWPWFSDVIGRPPIYVATFSLLAVLFIVLPSVTNPAGFVAVGAGILLCFGGGFGTMPAFVADLFGPRYLASIFGLMMTAWGVAGLLWPLLLGVWRDAAGSYDGGLYIIAAAMMVGVVLAQFSARYAREATAG